MKKNFFEIFKDKIKRMDNFHRQQILVYFMLFGFMIGETYVLVKLSFLANQYSQNIITLEEFIDLQNSILVFALVYMGFLCLGMILIYFWMKLLQKDYENEQLIQDSQEVVITMYNDQFKYLLQYDPSNLTLVRTQKSLLSLLENAELFSSLYFAYQNGVTVFTIDDTNILKEKFEQEVPRIQTNKKKVIEVEGT